MTQTNQELVAQGFEIKDEIVFTCNGLGLKNLLQAGQQWLEAHINVVNGLNVFPVPDGDTGTNMVLTMRSVMASVAKASGHEVGIIAGAAAHGAVMGARGNSGVILSQFLQGLATSLAGRTILGAEDLACAAQLGVEQAYKSVVKPVEGTILTVARAAAEAARQSVETNNDLVRLLTNIVEAAKVAQARTPELLPVLKEAGVTDAGGQGLVYILEGGLRFLKNEPVDVDPAGETVPLLQSTLGADEEAYGYDVQFLIQGTGLDVEAIRTQIDRLGWSTVVVGDECLVKVHVHTSNPGVPIGYGASQGVISDVVIENMEEQAREFVHEHAIGAPAAASTLTAFTPGAGWNAVEPVTSMATVCVVSGQGLARIFRSLGVSLVLPGGQTMNPSTQELLAAVERVQADNVLLLPNNRNVILAARQAETLSPKQVRVVPTQTIPQGIAACLAFNYQADFETNARRMLAAAQQAQTIEVTRAVRDSTFNGFKIQRGDLLGLFNNKLMVVGQVYVDVVLDLLAKLEPETYEVITIYFGQASSRKQAEALAGKINALYPEPEIEIHEGGQPHYDYIISLE